MIKEIKTLKDVDVKGKRVLLRVDFNVPLCKKTRKVVDDTRISEALPTILYLLSHEAKLIIMTHLGRPGGKRVADLRVDTIAEKLSELLKEPVKKLHECIGPKVEAEVKKLKKSQVLLLENTRFYHEEEMNDRQFAQKLAKLGEIFVSDGFGVIHRAHASTVGVADFLPAYAGLLLEKEIKSLYPLLQTPDRPLVLVVGGAKIDTKIGILNNFLQKTDSFLVGGALATTFLHAQGYEVGKSLYEKDKVEIAREIMLEAQKDKEKFFLPEDVVVADEASDTAKTLDIPIEDVDLNMKIFDIGSLTIQKFIKIIGKAGTIVWNGPLGVCEYKPFQHGSRMITRAIADSKGTTIIGGGDTIDAIKKFGYRFDNFTHVSTGGGAMLEFLEGKVLPGIEVLKKKKN